MIQKYMLLFVKGRKKYNFKLKKYIIRFKSVFAPQREKKNNRKTDIQAKFTFSTLHFINKTMKSFSNAHIFDILNVLGSFLVSLKNLNVILLHAFIRKRKYRIKLHFSNSCREKWK